MLARASPSRAEESGEEDWAASCATFDSEPCVTDVDEVSGAWDWVPISLSEFAVGSENAGAVA